SNGNLIPDAQRNRWRLFRPSARLESRPALGAPPLQDWLTAFVYGPRQAPAVLGADEGVVRLGWWSVGTAVDALPSIVVIVNAVKHGQTRMLQARPGTVHP
ncbi:MAG TPA: hypothetical protein VKP30_09530, partial [Polyangiaceae bacterium]|nr:hypothetical protein [Polyangiaceae bacterium]